MKKQLTGLMLIATAAVFFALGYIISTTINKSNDEQSHISCPDTEEFMEFLNSFNDDIRFQKERTLFPLLYSTFSNETDDTIDTFLIESAGWMPLEIFTTENAAVIIRQAPDDPCKITVTLRGINTGEYAVFTFIAEKGIWRLHSFGDYSD